VNSIATPDICALCGAYPVDCEWLPDAAAYAFRCSTCGHYALGGRLWSTIDRARTLREGDVMQFVPALRRAVRHYNALGDHLPHFTRENWRLEVREFLESALPPSAPLFVD
jgi:hypothetical protein